jgi:hypothetical protein
LGSLLTDTTFAEVVACSIDPSILSRVAGFPRVVYPEV